MKHHRTSQICARLLLAAALLCAVVMPYLLNAAAPSSLSDNTLLRIKFEQNLNAQLSMNLLFHDEAGKSVRLGSYFGKKPVILVLGYYECPMLCTLVLNGLVESLLDLKADVGRQFDVVNVSIDPTEKPDLAAAKKRTYSKRYGRASAATGWHFLTGDEAAIKQLADEVGFHYAYDPSIKQYAHPSGIIVVTPQGKVARYFFGIEYPPKELAASLRDAGSERVGSPIEQLILLCFHYSPLRGKYGRLIMLTLRVAGVLTLLAICWTVLRATQRKWNRPKAGPIRRGNEGGDVNSSREVAL